LCRKIGIDICDVGVFSTLNNYKLIDLSLMPSNTPERIQNGKIVDVYSIPLNVAIEKNFNSYAPFYINKHYYKS